MQQQYVPPPPRPAVNKPTLRFKGTGATFFGILILNMLLSVVTLGLYYPWARAKTLQFLYSSTELEGSRFSWNGTGKEMFIGFLKVMGIFLAVGAIIGITAWLKVPFIGILVYLAVIIIIFPLAIHGANRYHWSRTTWRGIRFGYRGNRNELIKLFIKEMLLTIITIGIYGSWMVINIRNYVISNVRMGSGEFKYEGDGWDFFIMNIKGYLLTIVTLGIYAFWWQADIFRYYIDHLRLTHNGKEFNFRSTASGGAFAGLLIVNALLFFFTLGLGYAWVQTRTISFLMENVDIEGDLVLDELEQTEEEYKNAMGEDFADAFDLNII
ncbi:MAG: DUF898 domain-containing protein [Chitinophaga sp.]|uniref:YjgN family protein n=1 Tax=Chitinophaga sp. TaxID=1869181 RepID=UPI0025BF78E7|nr:DUF898 family protein [Chitinophaga sp.]MBV8253493.1 DUF898 domain-containing protein [Chitinophaga sp.]